MVLFVSLVLVSAFVSLGAKRLKGLMPLCCGICALLAVAAVPLYYRDTDAWPLPVSLAAAVLTKGGLAGALFLFVMFAGAVPDRSAFQRLVMPMRGELSILASILALGHAAAYGSAQLPRLITGAGELRPSALLASLAALLLVLLLLPLFLSSLRRVRRRMKPKSWKRLQRFAYGFYALVYLHILLFLLPGVREGKTEAMLRLCAYTVVFGAYLTLRLGRAAVRAGHTGWLPLIQLGGAALLTGVLLLALWPGEEKETLPEPGTGKPLTWADGSYKGAAFGYNGRLKVSVVIEGGRIAEVLLKSHVEDEPYVTRAERGIFQAMLEQNTPDVDIVSTATTTSEALIEAVHQAIDGAEIP